MVILKPHDPTPPAVTRREVEILRAIVDLFAAKGYAPSVRELCEAIGISSTNGMVEHLRRLQAKGVIARDIATARSVRLTPAGKAEIAWSGTVERKER